MTKEQDRRATNPLFNDRPLKLGTFSTNLSGGCAMSSMEGVLEADWSSVSRLAALADQMEFEAIVPVGRWRGFGGVTDFNGAGFESYTFAAGVGAATRNPAIFATSHTSTIHPLVAAKQAMTVDHITGGRFALNIVTGWNRAEMEMFGQRMLEHDDRYDAAAEWLTIVRRAWQEDRPFSHEGRYYNVKDVLFRPRPIQRPHPAIMCAGASAKGQHFSAKYCDITFTSIRDRDPGAMKMQVSSTRDLARTEYQRQIGVWTCAYVFQGATEEEAWQRYHHCVHEMGDWTAVDNLMAEFQINSHAMPPASLQKTKEALIAGYGGYGLVGTAEQIVEGLAMLHRAGFDGVLLSWAAYVSGMEEFLAETYPLLLQSGLRDGAMTSAG